MNVSGFEAVSDDGPWDIQELLEASGGNLPRSPQQILDLARENGWGFGPITLVIRMNHPPVNGFKIPPFFMTWAYNHETGGWRFMNSVAQNGQRLNVRDAKAVLQEPIFLLPDEPDV